MRWSCRSAAPAGTQAHQMQAVDCVRGERPVALVADKLGVEMKAGLQCAARKVMERRRR